MSDISEQPAIIVRNITKTFRIPVDKSRSVKSKLLGKVSKGHREFTPLNGISFNINKGDFFGIVGRNGSGKSTLLKTIAGIYAPTSGSVKVNGVLVPFIELGVGFNPQLSGHDNVYLNCALLGFSRAEVDVMYEDIVDFAELHDFMEERLQNYSSGMQVRLAFSIAIRARGDILLLDEVLAVGDAAFQQKCYDYFEKLKKQNKTVILVTHNMANVERFCNKGLLLDEGKIALIGSSGEVADSYRELFHKVSPKDGGNAMVESNDFIKIKSVTIRQDTKKTRVVQAGKRFVVEFKLKLGEKSSKNHNISLHLRDRRDNLVLSTSTRVITGKYTQLSSTKNTQVSFDVDNVFTDGHYDVGMVVMAEPGNGPRQRIYREQGLQQFGITGFKHDLHSMTHPNIKATVE